MKYTAAFCLIIVLLASCSKQQAVPEADATAVFPNKVGDRWEYLVNDTFYLINNPPLITKYTMIVSVIDSVTLPGNIKANRWVYNTLGSSDTDYVYQHNDTISFLNSAPYTGNISRQYIVPYKLHNSWEYSYHSFNKVTIDSMASITIGQQQFENAFHIFGRPGRPDEILYISEWTKEKVGVVWRYVNNLSTNNPYKHLTSWSLLSYHVQ